jgi:hypothetical protein
MKKEKKRQARYYNRTAKDLHDLHPEDAVCVRPTHPREKGWREGTILSREGPRSYHVQTRKKPLSYILKGLYHGVFFGEC